MCLRYIQEVTYQVHVDSKSNELSKKGDALLDCQELSVVIGAKEVICAVIVCLFVCNYYLEGKRLSI